VLAVLFTLPRLRTLRPAALRKLSNEGAWRSEADAAPANDGREENPVFDFGALSVFGFASRELASGYVCCWRDLRVPVYVERDDRRELDDRREVVERAVRGWEAYGDRRADEGEGGSAGERGGDCGRSGGDGCMCVPSAKGPDIIGRAAEEVCREVVAGDFRVRLMSRFRPFVCWP
jgi:hypothetical protein